MANYSKAYVSAGKIYLPPNDSSVNQFWVNIGYDSIEGYKMPEYIGHFQGVCSRDAYESLMNDLNDLFNKNAQSRLQVFIRRRPQFEDAISRILKYHQNKSTDGKPCWPPKMLRWAYGNPVGIEPRRSYDQLGGILVCSVDCGGYFEERYAWPPPFYNIIINIPLEKYSAIRSRWAMGQDLNFQKEFIDRNVAFVVKNPCFGYASSVKNDQEDMHTLPSTRSTSVSFQSLECTADFIKEFQEELSMDDSEFHKLSSSSSRSKPSSLSTSPSGGSNNKKKVEQERESETLDLRTHSIDRKFLL